MHLWHRWRVVNAWHGEYRLFGGAGTIVLYLCKCGKSKTRTVDGHWTVEQLTNAR